MINETNISRRSVLAGAAAAFVLAQTAVHTWPFGGIPQASAAGDSKERVLRMGIGVDPDGLDPHRTAAAATFEITANIYDTLVDVEVDGKIVPGLAETWSVSEDGLEISFKLREGIVFSNGNPCDAQACVASFERLLDATSPRISQYSGYTFEAKDEKTFVAKMKQLNVNAVTDFAYAWSAVVDATTADQLVSAPIGTGPYKVDSWVPQQSVTLVRNEAYWGEAPSIGRVELRVLPNSASQLSSLRAGEIDLLMATSEQVEAVHESEGIQLIQAPQNGVQLMAMNCANEALSDVRVRQAINHAVNKDEIINSVWGGLGEKIGSHFPTMISGYVDCNDRYPYDVDAAASLLAEAGYSSGLRLRMRLPKDYQVYVDAGQIIADMLGKVGIECDIEIIEWATWLEEVYTGRDYDLTVVGHTGRLDPITLLARYERSSSENYFNYASDDVDDLIGRYRRELDADERAAIVESIQETLADDVPAVYLQDPITTYITKRGVDGFVMYPIDVYEFKDVSIEA